MLARECTTELIQHGGELTLELFCVQGLNTATKRLEITTTANQDPLLHCIPIIGVDMWEHAFYLQYLNVKADVSFTPFCCSRIRLLTLLIQYLEAIWQVINWQEAEKRYNEGLSSGTDAGVELSLSKI